MGLSCASSKVIKMSKPLVILASLAILAPAALQGCAQSNTPPAETPQVETIPNQESQAQTPTGETARGDKGTLQIVANGEDFVRQGFVSRDGWKITFDHVYVNLADVTAYQTDPPYNAEVGGEVKAKETVSVDKVKTVDLAAGDENAEPILVAEVQAPPGQYNALSWKMSEATEGPASGYPLMMQGTAEKEGETIDFTLKLDRKLEFTCGEFVGEDRKGIVQPGSTGELEATFHFDHLFGDGSAPPDDEINKGAVGFEPLAALAAGGKLDMDMAELQQALPEDDYRKLQELLPSLGHVGEGHCQEINSTT